MEEERVELEADIEKLHHTLEEDRNQWQYDYIVDSDDDDSEEDDDVLYIDLEKQGSAAASVASISAKSAGDKTISSAHSTTSQPTSGTETQSVGTEEQEEDGELFREVGVMQEELEAMSSLPATLESCLILNRAYQEVIISHISRIELELAENREAQRNIEEEAKESSIHQATKKRFPYNSTLPYFKMKFGSTPAPNEDTRLKRLTDEPDLDKRPEKAWHARQKTILTEAVTEDALEKMLQPLLSRRELEEEKLNDVGQDTEQWRDIKARITKLDEDIEKKKSTSNQALLQTVDPVKVDWMKIANMKFEGRRDWMACQRAWVHSVDPKLNHEVMGHSEEDRLIELIKETNGTNWIYVSEKLGTGRTPFQCLQYFQQNLNSEMLDRPWSKEEDEELIQVVEKCQHYHFNWRKVSHYMEGRSGMQCYKRYSKLDPNINKGYWTEAEDAQLMTAVQLLGTHNWGRVKELVPGRTREQCRERYCNSLDPNISGKPWSYEEDKTLLKLVAEHGKGNWVKCCKGLPGRTDNQILQRYRRLEDWRKKTEWFKKQSLKDRDLLQGNNLPDEQRNKTQEKNWEQFKEKFGVFPQDYRKQQEDTESGDVVVPRPPFMIGLANKSGGKVWERRIKLHKLIESHIDKLKEKYNFIHPSVAGVFELQDAISQLSQDCISQRDQLMNKRKDRLGELIHGLPSAINVKDLLAVSRGGKIHERKVRGPALKKKKGKAIAPRLLQSMKVDSELRKVVRASLKERGMKKGRPRRFFWDINGDQVLCDEEVSELKATAINLYLKSLGADHVQLLKTGRRAFPQLFHKLQQQQFQTSDQEQDQADPSTSSKSLRRSRRQKTKMESENPENADPFSLTEPPPKVSGFAEWQRQRDYELLEWLAREQELPLDDQLSEGVTPIGEMQAAASVEVETGVQSSSTAVMPESSQSVIGHGMSLVQASIERAMEEEERKAQQIGQAATSTATDTAAVTAECGSGQVAAHSGSRGPLAVQTEDASTSTTTATTAGVTPSLASLRGTDAVRSAREATSSQQAQTFVPSVFDPGSSRGPLPQFPNLPPTSNTIQSFKNLLLKRLGLIKKAGSFYNLPHYLTRKDQQMARLIHAGVVLKDMNRGTIDLSRMMNRVSQETDYLEPHKRKSRKGKEQTSPLPLAEQSQPDSRRFNYKVMESLRKSEHYQLLKSRFLSVFTWPALLSAIYPPFQRKEFCNKAGGQSHSHPNQGVPTYSSVRRMPPMLKSKGFYRYVNKTKEDKKRFDETRDKRRILKQVRDLMADENDPNPHVTLDPDSDDDAFSGYTEDPEPQSPPKKKRKAYRKRFRNAEPVRQSSRVTERKVYTDAINVKRQYGPRKPSYQQLPQLPRMPVQRVRPSRLHPTVRRAMINAMVERKERVSTKHGTRLGQWNPGGYVSDGDQDLGEELEKGGDWVRELPSELQDNLALLERESIVETAETKSAVVETGGTVAEGEDAASSGLPTPRDTHHATPHNPGPHNLPEHSAVNVATVDVSSPRVSSGQQTKQQAEWRQPSSQGHPSTSSQPPPPLSQVESDLLQQQFHLAVEQLVSTQPCTDEGAVDVEMVECSEDDDDDDEPSVASLLVAERARKQ